MIKNSEKAYTIGIFCSPFSLDLSRIQFKYFSFFGFLSFYFRSFYEMLLTSLLQHYFCFVSEKSNVFFVFAGLVAVEEMMESMAFCAM